MPYKLTPNAPDPLTGLQNDLLAWHFVPSDALDIFAALPWLKAYTTYDYHLYADPDDPGLQVLELVSPPPGETGQTTFTSFATAPIKFLIHNTDYFAFDGLYIRTLANDVVTANYSIEQVALPTPPAAPADTTVPA